MRLQNSIATVFLVYFLLIRVVILQNTVYTLGTKCLPKIGEKFLNGALDDLNTVARLERPRPFFRGRTAPQSRKFQNVKLQYVAIVRTGDCGTWRLHLKHAIPGTQSVILTVDQDRFQPGVRFAQTGLFKKAFFARVTACSWRAQTRPWGPI